MPSALAIFVDFSDLNIFLLTSRLRQCHVIPLTLLFSLVKIEALTAEYSVVEFFIPELECFESLIRKGPFGDVPVGSPHGHHVIAVGLIPSLSGLVLGLRVGPLPLHVHAIAAGNFELVGHKVILNRRKRLHNISTTASHV